MSLTNPLTVDEDQLKAFRKLFYLRFCVLNGQFRDTVQQGFLDILLYEFNCIYNYYKCTFKFAFILSFSLRENKKQELVFQKVSGMVKKNIASRALLQKHTEFNGLFQRNFVKCYSCSCCCPMFQFFSFQEPRKLKISHHLKHCCP